jgi:fatty acid-binding protein DegV
VPEAAALASRWLHLQALFEFAGGRARPLRPARNRASALDHIVDRWRSTKMSNARLHVAVLHAGNPDSAEALLRRVQEESGDALAGAFVAPFSTVMVAHTGPDLVGLSWWWDPNKE